MRKIKGKTAVVLAVLMLGVMLVGCGGQADEQPILQTSEVVSEVVSEEASVEVSEEVSEEVEEVVEETAELTMEEQIIAQMPAKLEIAEGEVITPIPVTKEMVLATMEEIKLTEADVLELYSEAELTSWRYTPAEFAKETNKQNLAGLLTFNCSYMDGGEFKELVEENYGTEVRDMLTDFKYHQSGYFGTLFIPEYDYYLYDSISDDPNANYFNKTDTRYGDDLTVFPEDLVYDKYLKHHAEQIHCLLDIYFSYLRGDVEFNKETELQHQIAGETQIVEPYELTISEEHDVLYDILETYYYAEEPNEYMTFANRDARMGTVTETALPSRTGGRTLEEAKTYINEQIEQKLGS